MQFTMAEVTILGKTDLGPKELHAIYIQKSSHV